MSSNRQLTVYLSKSLLVPEEQLKNIRGTLRILGFNVTEYKKGTEYNSDLIRCSDFVLFVPYIPSTLGRISPINNYNGRTDFSHFCGKGQYEEAMLCKIIKKDAFMYHYSGNNNDIMMSKMADEYHLSHTTYDLNDWKAKYGVLKSYVMGKLPTDLWNFVSGRFGLSNLPDHMKHYPMMPSECYRKNDKLLLLE